jgi:AP2 domain
MNLKLSNSPLYAMVDKEDWQHCKEYKWSLSVRGNQIKSRVNGVIMGLSNFVMKDCTCMFDHKNRNPFDNQKINLRPCNYSQNGINKLKSKCASSIYKGVSFDNKQKRWQAKIRKDYKTYWLGYFSSEIAAAKKYDQRAAEFFGEFAVLNFLK